MPGQMNIIVRLLWFYFVGLWIGGIWLNIAWILGITIIGLPICIWMIDLAPAIMTLKQEDCFEKFELGGRTAYVFSGERETSLVVRILYFVLVGWWLSLLWIELALFFAATFIGIPVSFWMINRLPTVMTLK